jgi:antitoxin YefM
MTDNSNEAAMWPTARSLARYNHVIKRSERTVMPQLPRLITTVGPAWDHDPWWFTQARLIPSDAPRQMTLVGIASRIPTMETLPITEVKTRLTEVVVQVEKQRDRILITRNGKPAALLVSVGEWESINETLDVLSDPEALKDIREADEAYARGDVFGNEDIAEILRARRDDVGHVA